MRVADVRVAAGLEYDLHRLRAGPADAGEQPARGAEQVEVVLARAVADGDEVRAALERPDGRRALLQADRVAGADGGGQPDRGCGARGGERGRKGGSHREQESDSNHLEPPL